jgi:hypothetical protein
MLSQGSSAGVKGDEFIRPFSTKLAATLGMPLFAVDYRKAPSPSLGFGPPETVSGAQEIFSTDSADTNIFLGPLAISLGARTACAGARAPVSRRRRRLPAGAALDRWPRSGRDGPRRAPALRRCALELGRIAALE